MELHERVGHIKSKEDLADFVSALRIDLEVNPGRWENPTLEHFLEAMEGWIRDMDGYYVNSGQTPPQEPTWKTVAHILMASTMYE